MPLPTAPISDGNGKDNKRPERRGGLPIPGDLPNRKTSRIENDGLPDFSSDFGLPGETPVSRSERPSQSMRSESSPRPESVSDRLPERSDGSESRRATRGDSQYRSSREMYPTDDSFSEDDDTFERVDSNDDFDSNEDDDFDDDSFLPSSGSPTSTKSESSRTRPTRSPRIIEEDEFADDDDDEDDEIDDDNDVEEESSTKKGGFFSRGNKPDKPSRSTAEKPSRPEKPVKGKSSGGAAKPERSKPTRGGVASFSNTGETEDTFVDKKNLKLKPFGSGRKKTVSKDGEFDKRENLRNKAQMYRIVTLALVGLLVALGLKNALIPPKTYSPDEIGQMVAAQAGDTGFPLSRGQGFAQNFMQAYLSSNNDQYAPRVLNFYYTGNFDKSNGSAQGVSSSTNFSQSIVSGPNVYSSTAMSPSTARYTIGAVVAPKVASNNGNSGNLTNPQNTKTDGSEAKWSFFSVSVYYDKKNDSFAIAPGSPIAVPAISVTQEKDIPQPAPIGTGVTDNELTAAVSPTVTGFIKAFATASTTDHSAIDPFITDVNNPSLTKGMGGRYTLQGEDSSAIQVEAYPSNTPGVVQAKTTVKWTDALSKDVQAQYTSVYVVTLTQQGSGKYLVSAISPLFFVPKEGDPATSTPTP